MHFVWLIMLVLITSVSLGQSDQVCRDKVRQPFRVIWNIPDHSCWGRYDKALRDHYIEHNIPKRFVGDTIATLYEPGWWPNFSGRDITKPINGGIPQYANFTAHYIALRRRIESTMTEDAEGYGVIDQEIWRALYDLNYSSFRVFQIASRNKVRPYETRWKQQSALAKKEFDKAAGDLMVGSLREAQKTRPNVQWGYYLYPQTWWSPSQSRYYNDEMGKIYEASTGIFPSVYIKKPFGSYNDARACIWATLIEAIRVRAVHTKRNIPIGTYIVIQEGINFFNQSLLDLAIGLPAEMGIDSVIIWGGSSIFKPNPSRSCGVINNYVHTTLGPYVRRLVHRLSDCSKYKCHGQGKCVKSEYVNIVPYILGVNIEKGQASNDSQGRYSDYECQCYDGSIGPYCITSSETIVDKENEYDY